MPQPPLEQHRDRVEHKDDGVQGDEDGFVSGASVADVDDRRLIALVFP
jgi:hypothetical protein